MIEVPPPVWERGTITPSRRPYVAVVQVEDGDVIRAFKKLKGRLKTDACLSRVTRIEKHGGIAKPSERRQWKRRSAERRRKKGEAKRRLYEARAEAMGWTR
jgi:hypothetical protein